MTEAQNIRALDLAKALRGNWVQPDFQMRERATWRCGEWLTINDEWGLVASLGAFPQRD